MKRKSHALVLLSWIHDILLFEGIYVFSAAIIYAEGTAIGIMLLKGLFMFVPIILSHIVIRRCKSLWIFLIFSLAAIWGMETVSQSTLTGAFTAFVCLSRCYAKLKQAEIRRKMRELPGESKIQEDDEAWGAPTLLDTPKISHCLFFVVLYLIIIYLHRYELLTPMLEILAAELCVCLAYYYLRRLNGFIKQNSYVANLPTSAMKKIGTGILLIGVTGLILFMLPSIIYHEEPLSNLKFEPADAGGTAIGYYEENTEPDSLMEELMKLNARAKKTPEWLKKASEIASVLTLLGIAYVALWMLVKVIRKAMESFSDDGDDKIIFLYKEDRDKEGMKKLSKGNEKEGFRSPNRKIRRLYKKLIRHTLRENPYGNETPFELEMKAGLYEKKQEETCKIHGLYEKARYGKEGCTKEEMKLYVDILSSLRRSTHK